MQCPTPSTEKLNTVPADKRKKGSASVSQSRAKKYGFGARK